MNDREKPKAPSDLEPTEAFDPALSETRASGDRPSRRRDDGPIPESIGDYRILGKLGEGGMGVVFEAEQRNPRRRVAVKVVRGGTFVDEHHVRMFQREADTLARLRHPNIGGIYESGRTADGRHFFAMELVRGVTLDRYLEQRPSLADRGELAFRLRLFRAIADAVHYAHQRGVIHRDLKPSNVIVADAAADETDAPNAASLSGSRDGPRLPDVKILDFGLARITEGDVATATMTTEIGTIKGTLAYMSPEQARGNPEDIDLRSDVYSLGVILYEMLSGKRPYEVHTKSLVESVRTICEDPPTPLARALERLKVDADVETIVGKALEKDVERRYGSAAALSEDVGRYLASQPILARPPSTVYQLRKFAARNRALVGGVVATFLVLIGGVVVSTVLGMREAAQRRVAEQSRADLQVVTEFQARMLEGIDAEAMGLGLFDALGRRLDEQLEDEGVPAFRRAAAVGALADALRRVNATDLSLEVLDENILARSERAVETELTDQPAVQAALGHTLGSTAVQLGLYERAEPLLRRAAERFDALGEAHEIDAADVRRDLALLMIFEGRLDEAEPFVDDALATFRRRLGPDAPETLRALDTRAMLSREAKDFEGAEETYLDLVERQVRVHGDDHEMTLQARGGLAWVYMEQARFEEAEAIFVDALARSREALGDDARLTMTLLNDLAVAYARQGRFAEAEPLYREDYERTLRILGREHSEMHVTITNFGRLYMRMGRYEEAEPLLREAVEIGTERFPPDHFGTAIGKHSLGETLVGLGRPAEAERYLLEAWDVLVEVFGPDHGNSRKLAESLRQVYEASGDRAEELRWASLAREPDDGV